MVFRCLSTIVACGSLLVAVAGSAAATDFKAGAIGIVKPTYEGSDAYEVVGAPFAYPVFSVTSSGTFSVNGADDVRLRLFNAQGFEAGVLGGYAFGRDESDGLLLRGLGDVDGGFIAGAFVGYRIGTTLFDISYHHIVSGDTGGFLRLGATNDFKLSPQLSAKIRVGATYADGDYMADYFGVSAAQAATSIPIGAAYDTDAGFKDVHIQLSANYSLTERWTLMGGVGYKRLIGDAADSPIVETEDQFSATFGLTYQFSIDR